MNYKIIKNIPIILFVLIFGIGYIIYEPLMSLFILIGIIFGAILLKWYNYFDKKEKKCVAK